MLNIPKRAGSIFLAFSIGHIILISVQVQATTNSEMNVLENVAFNILTGTQRIVTSVHDSVATVWSKYGALLDLKSQNEALSVEISALKLQLQEQRAVVNQSYDLAKILEFRETAAFPNISARVIGSDSTPYFRTLTISRGKRDGLRGDLAVITPSGIVGRIMGKPGTRAAKVQLLIDRNAAVGALIERSRVSGIVMGLNDDRMLRMEYVSNLEDVKAGDRIITSGIDGIYPKGFEVGVISKHEVGKGLYQTISITPTVDFLKLENVLVIMSSESSIALGAEN